MGRGASARYKVESSRSKCSNVQMQDHRGVAVVSSFLQRRPTGGVGRSTSPVQPLPLYTHKHSSTHSPNSSQMNSAHPQSQTDKPKIFTALKVFITPTASGATLLSSAAICPAFVRTDSTALRRPSRVGRLNGFSSKATALTTLHHFSLRPSNALVVLSVILYFLTRFGSTRCVVPVCVSVSHPDLEAPHGVRHDSYAPCGILIPPRASPLARIVNPDLPRTKGGEAKARGRDDEGVRA